MKRKISNKTHFFLIGMTLLCSASSTISSQTNNTESKMQIIEFIPKEFHDVKLGYYENTSNPCTPYHSLRLSESLLNKIAINIPEKIIYNLNLSDNIFTPVIPVCGAYFITERRSAKYIQQLAKMLYIRKMGEEKWYSGKIVDRGEEVILEDGTTVFWGPSVSPPLSEEGERKRSELLKTAPTYSDEELNEGEGSGDFININLLEYIDMPFEAGIYEIYLSFCGLESNHVEVEIIINKN
jgi:hypothetical protein